MFQEKQKDSLAFRTSVAQALCMKGKDMSRKKRGRPSSDVERDFEKEKYRGPAKAVPTLEVRSGAVGHWPVKDMPRGRPSSDAQRDFEKKKHRSPAKAIPILDIRLYAVGHWPVVESGRQSCKRPNCKGQTVIKCAKCNVHLCLNKNKNCFREFHEQDCFSSCDFSLIS